MAVSDEVDQSDVEEEEGFWFPPLPLSPEQAARARYEARTIEQIARDEQFVD